MTKAPDARVLYLAAIRGDPPRRAWAALAAAAHRRGDVGEWRRRYDSALRTAPDELSALLALGQIHRDAGESELAEAVLDRAVQRAPRSAPALTNHGLVLSDLGRAAEAVQRQREAVEVDPKLAAAWVNLALALRQVGDLPGAEDAQRRAVALEPGAPHAHLHAGLALQAQGRLLEAQGAYRHALSLDHRLPETWINLGITLMEAGDAAAAATAFEQALARVPRHRGAAGNLLLNQQYDGALAAADLRASALRWGALWDDDAPAVAPRRAAPGARLRVGYLGADFCRHPVGWLLAPMLEAHDRGAVEVHCFDHQVRADDGDAMTQRLRAASEHWHAVAALDDDALCALVRACGIDVLVELSGHTDRGRLGVPARRAAPVQLSWLGYFASTGLKQIDAVVLGGAVADEGAEAFYTEALERLPRVHFAYAPPDYAPDGAVDVPSAAGGGVTFGSFNNAAKLGDAVVQAWAQVLHAVPGSRLALRWKCFGDPAFGAHTQRRFVRHGIAPERLCLLPAAPHAEMLAGYGEIDVALDPFPFSGLVTTLEALWMGVPVVTLPWRRPVSRQTLAVLEAIGLADLAAATPRDYVARAAALAADIERRRELRLGLRARIAASPIADGAGLARELESLYRRRAARARMAQRGS